MRRKTPALLSALALALPAASAVEVATADAATAKTKTVTATKSFTGPLGSAQRWGNVEVVITVRKTTTENLKTKKSTVTRRIVSVKVPVFPNHTDRSIFISNQALPFLIQETVKAQSASIDLVSGATYTSEGFDQSLQSALLKAKAW